MADSDSFSEPMQVDVPLEFSDEDDVGNGTEAEDSKGADDMAVNDALKGNIDAFLGNEASMSRKELPTEDNDMPPFLEMSEV